MRKTVQYLRLYEALTYLKRERGINQQKLAELMGTSQPAISRNLQTAQAGALNLDFVHGMNTAVGKIFNVEYIVNGTGSLLSNDKSAPEPAVESAEGLIGLAARLIGEVEQIRHELQEERAETHRLNRELQRTLSMLSVYVRPESGDALPMAAEPSAKPYNKKKPMKKE